VKWHDLGWNIAQCHATPSAILSARRGLDPVAFLEGGHARVGPRLFQPLVRVSQLLIGNPEGGVESNRPLEFCTRLDILADVCQHPFAPHILALNIEFMQTLPVARSGTTHHYKVRKGTLQLTKPHHRNCGTSMGSHDSNPFATVRGRVRN